MPDRTIRCTYNKICSKAGSSHCFICAHNTLRNQLIDCFQEAHDNPIPKQCPKLTYSGTAEQTDGYKCPVCGCYTNPYALGEDHLCNGCGYKLNV